MSKITAKEKYYSLIYGIVPILWVSENVMVLCLKWTDSNKSIYVEYNKIPDLIILDKEDYLQKYELTKVKISDIER